jgi:uncharacterized protein YceH (UPF0502 family)
MVDPALPLDLSATQARVLGSLVEKQLTTPDAYPLTLKALTTACNQSTNRDPVLFLEPQSIETAVLALKSKGLARVVHPGSGERATKYRQVSEEALGLSGGELAAIALLLLRGAQTTAELRARSERLHPFTSIGDVESTLAGLVARGLVTGLDPQPGQKERRWLQLLEVGAEERAASAGRSNGSSSVGGNRSGGHVQELEARVAALEARVESLVHALGDLVDLPVPDSSA